MPRPVSLVPAVALACFLAGTIALARLDRVMLGGDFVEFNLEIADLTTEEADLEAIFLRLTQSAGDGEGETGARGADDLQAGPLSLSRTRPAP